MFKVSTVYSLLSTKPTINKFRAKYLGPDLLILKKEQKTLLFSVVCCFKCRYSKDHRSKLQKLVDFEE